MLAAVATNGHTLVLVKTELPANGMSNVIVPSKTVGELGRFGKNGVKLRVGPKIIEVSTGTYRLCSKLIDGTFPDYLRVIPQASSNVCEVDRVDLIAALTRMKAVAGDDGKSSPCGIAWNNGGEIELILASNPQAGSDTLAATTSGKARVAVSIRLLVEMLGSLDRERVRLDVPDAAVPIRITVVGNDGFLAILMPMASRWTITQVAA
jgi:DNA polymerase-3 subunit beta